MIKQQNVLSKKKKKKKISTFMNKVVSVVLGHVGHEKFLYNATFIFYSSFANLIFMIWDYTCTHPYSVFKAF